VASVLRVEVRDEVGMKYAGRPSPETSIVVARWGSNPKDVVGGSTADRSGKFLMYIVFFFLLQMEFFEKEFVCKC
jgi:hypothetical protein